MALVDPQFHYWLPKLNSDWIAEAYPDDVAELFVEHNEESDGKEDICSSDDDKLYR